MRQKTNDLFPLQTQLRKYVHRRDVNLTKLRLFDEETREPFLSQ